MINQKFETRDHELASHLVTMGYAIDGLRWEEQENGKMFGIFIFTGNSDILAKELEDFFMGKPKMVSTRDLFANHKKLRTWLYDSRDRLEK